MKTSTWDTTVPNCSGVDAFWWSAIWCCKCKSSAHWQFAAGFVEGKECTATGVPTSSSSCVLIPLLHSASLLGGSKTCGQTVQKWHQVPVAHPDTTWGWLFYYYYFFNKGPALLRKLKLRCCPTVFHQNLSYVVLADASLVVLLFVGSASYYHWENYLVKWWSAHLLLSLKSGLAAIDVRSQFIQREPFPWVLLTPKLLSALGGIFNLIKMPPKG